MNNRTQWLRRWVGGLVAFGLIGAAVLLTVLRIALPFAADYRAYLEDQVAAYLGTPVSIGAMEVEWHGLGPRLRLVDLRLSGPPPARAPVNFDEAFVELGLAVEGDAGLPVRINSVSLVGLDLEVTLDERGRLSLLGATIPAEELIPRGDPPPPFVRELAGWLLGTDRLQLLDASIDIIDASGAQTRLSDISLRMRNDGLRHQAALSVRLPPSWGGTLEAALDASGRTFGEWSRWRGRAWARGSELALARWFALYPEIPWGVQRGEGGFSAWLDFGDGAIDAFTLQAGGEGLDIVDRAGQQTVGFERLAGLLHWRQRAAGGWQLDVGELEVRREGRSWPGTGLSLARSAPSEDSPGKAVWRMGSTFLRIEDLRAAARLVPGTEGADAAWRERLEALAPRGDLRRVHGVGVGPGDFALRGRFEQVGWSPSGEIPGAEGLDGRFEAGPGRFDLTLGTRDARLRAPRFLSGPLSLATLDGDLRVDATDDGLRVETGELRFSNADGQATARVAVEKAAEQPAQLDIEARFADLPLAALPRYLPARLIPEGVMTGLERTLQGGQVQAGRLRLEGALADFPYRDGAGTFTVELDVRDAILAYAPGWPALRDATGSARVDGVSLSMEAERARLYGIQARSLRARIPDLDTGLMTVEARADAPLSDLVRLVEESPLASGLGGFLGGARASGNAPLALDLRVPLRRPETIGVSGRLDLEGDRLIQPGLDLDLRDLAGTLRFSREGIETDGLRTTVRGRRLDLVAGIEREEAPVNVITARGDLNLRDLVPDLPARFVERFRGRSPWRIDVRIPLAGDAPVRLAAESDLKGVTVDLPAPLGKASPARRRLGFSLALDGPLAGQLLSIGYEDRLRARLELGGGAPDEPAIRRGTIRFGDGTPALRDAPGLSVAGAVERVDLRGWAGMLLGGEGGPAGPAFAGGRLAISDAWYGEYALSRLRLDARQVDGGWSIDLGSNEITGKARVPSEAESGEPIRVRLEWVDLGLIAPSTPADDSGAGALAAVEPATLPRLDVRIQRFKTRNAQFERIALVTSPAADGMTIHRLEFTNDDLQLEGQGFWRGGEPSRTALRLLFDSDNLGAGLGAIGYPGALVEGEGRVTADLAWSGPPWSPTFEALEGYAEIALEDGLIPEVDPGPARLLGLLSLRALPQMLSLDFRGLVQKGYAFDQIQGRIDFADGNAYSRGLDIEGPVGRMIISGRTGLVARDYDQTVRFQPQLSSSLPLLGALSGGPVAGVAVALIQGVLRNMGADVEEATEIRYTLTGTWADPIVQQVSETPDTPVNEPSPRSPRQPR